MAKYAIEDTTLTGIADAIREKAGTTGAIATSQMAESILAIKGGLSLDVVTASSLPGTVVNGQIVVITDTTPGTVYVDTDEPVSTAPGDLWIEVAAGGDAALVLTEESPVLRNGLVSANQWDGTAWQTCDGHIGVAGVWVQFAMALPPVGTALNDMSWEDIAKVAEAGKGADYFAVGDRKAVAVNGKIGNATLNGTFYCYIIGINHNEAIEGKGIHFQFGWTALQDGKNLAFTYNYTGGRGYIINESAANAGGWESSYMRNTVCPAFIDTLPEALQSVIKSCVKYTDNKGSTGSGAASSVTPTSDKIWLPSQYEMHGSTGYANATEAKYQAQYEYYSAGNSKQKYRSDSQGSYAKYWTRSPAPTVASAFMVVTDNEASDYLGCATSYGFAPCFKV